LSKFWIESLVDWPDWIQILSSIVSIAAKAAVLNEYDLISLIDSQFGYWVLKSKLSGKVIAFKEAINATKIKIVFLIFFI
jgi:hypothetical protein